jgi:hypothetical protein
VSVCAGFSRCQWRRRCKTCRHRHRYHAHPTSSFVALNSLCLARLLVLLDAVHRADGAQQQQGEVGSGGSSEVVEGRRKNELSPDSERPRYPKPRRLRWRCWEAEGKEAAVESEDAKQRKQMAEHLARLLLLACLHSRNSARSC